MAYDLTGLQTTRDSAMARLTEMIAAPKPDYQIDGQSFNWTQYQRYLLELIDKMNDLIARETGPVQEETLIL